MGVFSYLQLWRLGASANPGRPSRPAGAGAPGSVGGAAGVAAEGVEERGGEGVVAGGGALEGVAELVQRAAQRRQQPLRLRAGVSCPETLTYIYI